MAQILTTELPALTTKSSGVLSLIDDSVCATCGGDLVMDSDNPTVTFCGKCYAVDLAPTRATLAAAAWAKAAGHEVDEISVSEWTDEGNETPQPHHAGPLLVHRSERGGWRVCGALPAIRHRT